LVDPSTTVTAESFENGRVTYIWAVWFGPTVVGTWPNDSCPVSTETTVVSDL